MIARATPDVLQATVAGITARLVNENNTKVAEAKCREEISELLVNHKFDAFPQRPTKKTRQQYFTIKRMIMEANKSEDVLQTTVEEITQCLRAQVQRSAEETAWRKGTVDQLKTAMIELAKQPQPRTGPSEMPPPRRRHRATDTRQPVAASAKQQRAADKDRKLKRALQEATAQAIG
jgi:hypothetical protein